MKKRIHVKFRVDMYDDIKCKIIDTKARRDLIHYVLARFIVLAGKVDLDGELYITENMPYTIETLAIEFNRSYEEVEYAIGVLNELEIIDISKENTLKVKNWAKHQNNCRKKEIIKENHKKEEPLRNNILVEESESEKSIIEAEVERSATDKSIRNNEKIYCEKESKPIDNLNKPNDKQNSNDTTYFIESNLTKDKNSENSTKITINCNPKIKNTNGSNRKAKKNLNSTEHVVPSKKYGKYIDEKTDMVPIKELFGEEEVISIFAEDQDDFFKGEGRIVKVFDFK